MANKIKTFRHFLLITALFFVASTSFAYEPVDKDQDHNTTATKSHEENEGHEAGGFDAGKMILEHVADNHQWHLWGHTSIPLPVIVKTDKGIEVFSSSHFGHEGEEQYQGANYKYALHEGSIVIVDEIGVNEEATTTLTDFSITKNVASMFITMLLMLWVFLTVAKAYKRNPGKAPKGLQSFVEPLIMFVRDDVAKPSIGEKRYERFMPFLLTVFFFVMFSNYLGLVPFFPGGVNLTGSISVAMVLAGFTLVITFFVANKHYWHHIFAMPGVPIPVLIILTPIEILGVFLRPFVLMIRLFANITAGHIIALAFFSLIFIFGEMNTGLGFGVSLFSLVFTVFMGFLELLVAFLQAYVFTLLSAIYFGSAVDEGHDVHNHVDDHKGEHVVAKAH
ncbi:MAG: F0F1 ATP synthase subunit A [Bacteroidetes bacterium]|nr:F0F1 ATP synthase subunit A [Bacteroidota bacterium]